MREQERQSHWENIFKTKDYREVLWHQKSPALSYDLITTYADRDDAILDAGCGASLLVDKLIENGYNNITLLDTSATSLDIVKKRLEKAADLPNYICSDIMDFSPDRTYAIWHDRAVFHFLLTPQERADYFEKVMQTLAPGGIAIISTFRVGGQTQCAGLDIVQYDHQKMLEELPEGLKLIAYEEFTHVTPAASEQDYSAFVIKKL